LPRIFWRVTQFFTLFLHLSCYLVVYNFSVFRGDFNASKSWFKKIFILKKIVSKLTDEIRRKGERLFALSVNAWRRKEGIILASFVTFHACRSTLYSSARWVYFEVDGDMYINAVKIYGFLTQREKSFLFHFIEYSLIVKNKN